MLGRRSNWMKRLPLALLLALTLVGTAVAQGAEQPTPIGVWIAFDDKTGIPESQVQIYRYKNGLLAGKIIRLLRDPNAICESCTGKEKGRSRKGLVIMWNLQRDEDEWDGGRILDPENGRTYRCKIWLEGPDELKVRGYLGPLYRTQTWKRVAASK